ncbi:bifunctional folylpolyglutamate synthase/ dihydrofolate synthase [Deltaproteobacteria bacterium TL4]
MSQNLQEENQSYDQVLSQLDQYGNFEKTAVARDMSKLIGIQQLLEDLGHPEQHYQIIHIAGTNGKGLTGKMISQMLCKEGYQVGWYNSPHLADIRERIVLNDQWIEKASFARHASQVLALVSSYHGTPFVSFFDILTTMAFCAFKEAQLEWVVLETGLGGKADSTNVTPKALSIITSIGWDHMNVLGNTLKEIALEKLGILREGVPVILAPQEPSIQPLIRDYLQRFHIPAYHAEDLQIENNADHLSVQWNDGEGFQIQRTLQHTLPWRECLKLALQGMQCLFQGTIQDRKKWATHVSALSLPGRLEYYQRFLGRTFKEPFLSVVFDGGHNAEAINALISQLKLWEIQDYILILGISRDKLVLPLRKPLLELASNARQVIFTTANSARSASSEQLLQFVTESTTMSSKEHFQCSSNVEDALNAAYALRHRPLVVAGSFYLLGDVMRMLT